MAARANQQVYYDSDYQDMAQPVDYWLYSHDDHNLYLHGNKQLGNPSWNEVPLGLTVGNPPLLLRLRLKENEIATSVSALTDPIGDEEEMWMSTSLLGFEDVSLTPGTFPD